MKYIQSLDIQYFLLILSNNYKLPTRTICSFISHNKLGFNFICILEGFNFIRRTKSESKMYITIVLKEL